jgi:hypothetical protein
MQYLLQKGQLSAGIGDKTQSTPDRPLVDFEPFHESAIIKSIDHFQERGDKYPEKLVRTTG